MTERGGDRGAFRVEGVGYLLVKLAHATTVTAALAEGTPMNSKVVALLLVLVLGGGAGEGGAVGRCCCRKVVLWGGRPDARRRYRRGPHPKRANRERTTTQGPAADAVRGIPCAVRLAGGKAWRVKFQKYDRYSHI